jgi:hypothetical protein
MKTDCGKNQLRTGNRVTKLVTVAQDIPDLRFVDSLSGFTLYFVSSRTLKK